MPSLPAPRTGPQRERYEPVSEVAPETPRQPAPCSGQPVCGAPRGAWAPLPGPSAGPSRPLWLPTFPLPKARLLAVRDPVTLCGVFGAGLGLSRGHRGELPAPRPPARPATHCFQTAPRCSAAPGCSRRRAGPRTASRRGCGAGSGWPGGSAAGAAALWGARAREAERKDKRTEKSCSAGACPARSRGATLAGHTSAGRWPPPPRRWHHTPRRSRRAVFPPWPTRCHVPGGTDAAGGCSRAWAARAGSQVVRDLTEETWSMILICH